MLVATNLGRSQLAFVAASVFLFARRPVEACFMLAFAAVLFPRSFLAKASRDNVREKVGRPKRVSRRGQKMTADDLSTKYLFCEHHWLHHDLLLMVMRTDP